MRGVTLHKPTGANLMPDLYDRPQISFRLTSGEGQFFQNKAQVLDDRPKAKSPAAGRHLEVNLRQSKFYKVERYESAILGE